MTTECSFQHPALSSRCTNIVQHRVPSTTPCPVPTRRRYSIVETHSTRSTRLQTFSQWPHSTPSRETMASSGWCYCRISDRVLCIYCDTICHGWQSMDDPREVHARLAPHCPFVLCMTPCDTTPAIANQTMKEEFRPSHPSMCELSRRMATFQSPAWKQASPTIEDFARAGFFYSGGENHVSCFYCGGSLSNWGLEDDPVVEHGRWFPLCTYARHLCGDQYHRKVQQAKNLRPKASSIDPNTLNRLVQARLDLPSVRQLLNQYSMSVVKHCIENQ